MSGKATFYFVADDGSDPLVFTRAPWWERLLARLRLATSRKEHL